MWSYLKHSLGPLSGSTLAVLTGWQEHLDWGTRFAGVFFGSAFAAATFFILVVKFLQENRFAGCWKPWTWLRWAKRA